MLIKKNNGTILLMKDKYDSTTKRDMFSFKNTNVLFVLVKDNNNNVIFKGNLVKNEVDEYSISCTSFNGNKSNYHKFLNYIEDIAKENINKLIK